MGLKIHVAEEYHVKYRVSDNFNGKQSEINRLLNQKCEDIAWDGEDLEFSSQIEIPRKELAKLIGEIVYNRRDFELWRKENHIQETLDEIIEIIAKWIASSDQSNDFVVLSWF